MKSFTIAAVATLFLSAGTYATCYTSGEHWQTDISINAADLACKHLVGKFSGSTSHILEVKVPNQCYKYVLENLSSTAQSVGLADCKKFMHMEVNGCVQGGHRKHGDWVYTADPNRLCTTSDPLHL